MNARKRRAKRDKRARRLHRRRIAKSLPTVEERLDALMYTLQRELAVGWLEVEVKTVIPINRGEMS